jgi:hypothetical protein
LVGVPNTFNTTIAPKDDPDVDAEQGVCQHADSQHRQDHIRLCQPLDETIHPAAEPYARGGKDHRQDGGQKRTDQTDDQCEWHAPQQGHDEVTPQIIRPRRAVDLTQQDEFAPDIRILFEQERLYFQLIRASERLRLVGKRVCEQYIKRRSGVHLPKIEPRPQFGFSETSRWAFRFPSQE